MIHFGVTIHFGTTVGRKGNLKAIDCRFCGFAHLDLLPRKCDVRAYYETQFYQVDKAGWRAELDEDAEWERLNARIELGFLPSPHKGADAMLDVGCGFGDFIGQAQVLGWDAAGIEPSPLACAELYKREIKYEQGYIEDAGLYPESADVIRLAWLLEHMHDPKAILRKCHRTLKPNGYLLATVPNDFNPLQMVYADGGEAYWLGKAHLNYFTVASFFSLLNKCGFIVKDFCASYPLELFLLQGRDYLNDHALGRACHTERKQMEIALSKSANGMKTLLAMRQNWARIGIGRDLTIVARRKVAK